MTIRHLDRLLEPASVAVLGASSRPASVGATVWNNLLASGFAGPVWAVNPNHAAIGTTATFPTVAALPQAPELALICTPPATVADLVAQLAERGTRAAVVMTAGLTPAQKQAALDAARPHLLRLLGPNCIGLMSPRIGLNASFAHRDGMPGPIAFVSQSGALVTAMIDWAAARGIGFSHLVSLGEQADVDVGDLLDFLAADPHTRAILLYLESVVAPRKFMSAARAAARNKPVVVVKAGRSSAGSRAAASHTGALAGADLVVDAALRRAGLLRVDTLAQLFDAAATLARFGVRRSEGLTIVTNGGGAGVMAADAAEAAGVPLAPLPDAVRAQLDTLLPGNWSRGNPVDIIGDAPVDRYTGALEALLAAPETGTLLFVHAPTAIVAAQAIAQACAPIVQRRPDRVMACWLGDTAVAPARQLFSAAGIADYATPEDAVDALAMLRTWHTNQDALMQVPHPNELPTPDRAGARAIVEHRLAEGEGWLDEADAKALLACFGIPTVPTRKLPADADALVAAAQELGWPVVLKIRSPDLLHKSDLGGVRLDIPDAAALREAAATMLARIAQARPDARIEGFTLQTMVRRRRAHELIVGTSVDGVFGPVILFGAGGTAVEVLGDRAIALPPLNRALAADLVARTRIARLLAGWRDHPAVKIAAVHDVLIAVAQLLAEVPELAELDINPLLADEDGVVALDARVRIAAAKPAGAAHFAIRPYPADLERTIDWNGRHLLLRPIRPEDEPRHRAFIEKLDAEDLRMRIFHSRRVFAASELARLTQIDYDREIAIVAVHADETLGVVRAVSDPDGVEAEFAVIVRSDCKGSGLGTILMDRLVEIATARGLQRLVGDILFENHAMLALARDCGFETVARDAGVVHVRKSLAPQ
jgi:acetyltransferase